MRTVSANKQNLTLSLDKETIRRAKILAAERCVSVSRLIAEEITRLVEEADAYRRAHRSALEELAKGFRSGGYKPVPREELHER
jgi:hypothetical protein